MTFKRLNSTVWQPFSPTGTTTKELTPKYYSQAAGAALFSYLDLADKFNLCVAFNGDVMTLLDTPTVQPNDIEIGNRVDNFVSIRLTYDNETLVYETDGYTQSKLSVDDSRYVGLTFIGRIDNKSFYTTTPQGATESGHILYEREADGLRAIAPTNAADNQWQGISFFGKHNDTIQFDLVKGDATYRGTYREGSLEIGSEPVPEQTNRGKLPRRTYFGPNESSSRSTTLYEREAGIVRDIPIPSVETPWSKSWVINRPDDTIQLAIVRETNSVEQTDVYQLDNGNWTLLLEGIQGGVPQFIGRYGNVTCCVLKNQTDSVSWHTVTGGSTSFETQQSVVPEGVSADQNDSINYLGVLDGVPYFVFEATASDTPDAILKLNGDSLTRVNLPTVRKDNGEIDQTPFITGLPTTSMLLLLNDEVFALTAGEQFSLLPSPVAASRLSRNAFISEQADGRAIMFFEAYDIKYSKLCLLDLHNLVESSEAATKVDVQAGSATPPWAKIVPLGSANGTDYLQFIDANNAAFIFAQSGSGLANITPPESSWVSVVYSGEVKGNPAFTLENSENFVQLYVRTDSQWEDITPDGDWIDILSLGTSGDGHYYQMETGEGSYLLFMRDAFGEWNDITPDGDWRGVALLAEQNGVASFRLQDADRYFHLFEKDEDGFSENFDPYGAGLQDITPWGSWLNIEVLDGEVGQGTHGLEDESGSLHLYERTHGDWFEVGLPDGPWTNFLLVGRHEQVQYFKLQTGKKHWHLYEYSAIGWRLLSPAAKWLGCTYLGHHGSPHGEQPLFGLYDKHGYHIYRGTGAGLEKMPSGDDWAHVAYIGRYATVDYFRVHDFDGQYHLLQYDGNAFEHISPPGDWREIRFLGGHDARMFFDFRASMEEMYLYMRTDQGKLKEITPKGNWRSISYLGLQNSTEFFAFEDDQEQAYYYQHQLS